MRRGTDYTVAWLAAAALLVALWAASTDQPQDLNNNRCLEAPGGTDQC